MGDLMVLDREESSRMNIEEEEEEERESGVVRWDEYLPRMVIRVLLVEADDSTRQIIAALLRKCNYKVAAIPDGLKAWEILKQKHSNIDLILTEVDLPSISGYALLTLIMEHDSCKNIPVIMMSSSDSISMVFKCMLKGAADFLIKPVRRNELKNLWQHVWRRISQSNNASGAQNVCGSHGKAETSSKSKGTINCSDDNVSSSKEKSHFPEKAIDAQSSCATHYLEAETPHVENMQGFSQMKHHGSSNSSHNEVQQHENGMRLGEETDEGKSSRFEASRVAQDTEAYASTSRLERVGSSSGRMVQFERSEPESYRNMDALSSEELNEHTGEAIDLIGTMNNHFEYPQQQINANCEMHNSSATQLELSLSRTSDPEEGKSDGKQKLNHSNASAFSRYSSGKKLGTLFPSFFNSLTEVEGGDKLVALPKPANACDIDEENKSTVMTGPTAHPEPTYPASQIGLGSVYPSMFSPQASRGTISLKQTNQKDSSPLLASTSLHSDTGTYCSSLGHSGFDETNNTDEKIASVDQQKYGNGTLGNNGSVEHIHNNATNDNALQAMVRTITNVEEFVRDSGGNMLMNEQFGRAKGGIHNAQRDAALAKFRQKRKDRCFEKKVRYQSRKRLAEQRPRVKGQFVRQVQNDQPVLNSDTRYEDNG